MIDAIICEYKKGIDMNHESLQDKNIVVFVDSRDKDDYPGHIRSSWYRKSTDPHLASSRMYFKGCKSVEIFSVHCRDPTKHAHDYHAGDPIDNYIEKALAKIFPWCES